MINVEMILSSYISFIQAVEMILLLFIKFIMAFVWMQCLLYLEIEYLIYLNMVEVCHLYLKINNNPKNQSLQWPLVLMSLRLKHST